jgi:integrase
MLLGEAFDTHLVRLSHDKLAQNVLHDYRFVKELLVGVTNNKPVSQVVRLDIDLFQQTLAKVPPRWSALKRFRGMALLDVIAVAEKENMEPIAWGTQGKYVHYLQAAFKMFKEWGWIAKDPTATIDLGQYANRSKVDRGPFSKQELACIFAPEHTDLIDKPHHYWVPILALFTGMRLNEIAQLYVDDVNHHAGVDYVIVSEFYPGQKLKTANAPRHIPLHPTLIELGFLDYVKQVEKMGFEHLFPGLDWEENSSPGHAVGKWFNQTHLRKTCGIQDAGRVFHSFRHTFATTCHRAAMAPLTLTALMGHTPGAVWNPRIRRFVKIKVERPNLHQLQRSLKRVPFPSLPLRPYQPERCKVYLGEVWLEQYGARQAKTAMGRLDRVIALN